jgi:hypothetical protein
MQVIEKSNQQFSNQLLDQSERFTRLLEALQTGIVQRQPERETPSEPVRAQPFTSVDDVRRCIEAVETGRVAKKSVVPRVDATISYVMQLNRVNLLPGVPQERWKKAKIVEMLYEIEKAFPRDLVSEYCAQKIRSCCLDIDDNSGRGANISREHFEYMKLLLMSQCNTWNEEVGTYELSPKARTQLVREVLGKLLEIIDDEQVDEGLKEETKRFLVALKGNDDFENFSALNSING